MIEVCFEIDYLYNSTWSHELWRMKIRTLIEQFEDWNSNLYFEWPIKNLKTQWMLVKKLIYIIVLYDDFMTVQKKSPTVNFRWSGFNFYGTWIEQREIWESIKT